jgi:hypothetical protein
MVALIALFRAALLHDFVAFFNLRPESRFALLVVFPAILRFRVQGGRVIGWGKCCDGREGRRFGIERTMLLADVVAFK